MNLRAINCDLYPIFFDENVDLCQCYCSERKKGNLFTIYNDATCQTVAHRTAFYCEILDYLIDDFNEVFMACLKHVCKKFDNGLHFQV